MRSPSDGYATSPVLTERQRHVFVAVVLQGVPLDALVVQVGSNRTAIYKTLFDARRKLRAALAAHGYLTSSADKTAGVAAHLAACGPCGDDFQGLLAGIGTIS